MAHARRKFFDLHAAKQSQLAEQALQYIGQLYEVEREGRELLAEQRRQLRQDKARPIIDGLHSWMVSVRSLLLLPTSLKPDRPPGAGSVRYYCTTL